MPHAGTLGHRAQLPGRLPHKLRSSNSADTLGDNLTEVQIPALFRTRFTPTRLGESGNVHFLKSPIAGITREVIESKRPALAGILKSTVKGSVLRPLRLPLRAGQPDSPKMSCAGITREMVESKRATPEDTTLFLSDRRFFESPLAHSKPRGRAVSPKTSYAGITREAIESKGSMCVETVESSPANSRPAKSKAAAVSRADPRFRKRRMLG